MMKFSILTAVFFSQLVIAPSLLAAGDDPPAPALTGTNWVLVEPSRPGSETGSAITLRLEPDGRLRGTDGCNRYGGTYTVDGAVIRISGKLMGTRMACPGSLQTRAGEYTQSLVKAATFSIDNRLLVLSDSSGERLAIFQADSAELAGNSWRVTGYNNGRHAVTSVLTGTQLTLVFGEDGRVTGSAGCNTYFAPYRQSDESISIGMPVSTRRVCAQPQGVMAQEAAFFAAIASAATLQKDADRLTLRTADAAIALTLEAQ